MSRNYDPKYWPKSHAAEVEIAVILEKVKNGDVELDQAQQLILKEAEVIKEEYSDFMIDGGMYI